MIWIRRLAGAVSEQWRNRVLMDGEADFAAFERSDATDKRWLSEVRRKKNLQRGYKASTVFLVNEN